MMRRFMDAVNTLVGNMLTEDSLDDFDVIAYHGSDQDFDSFDEATIRANRWGPYGFCFTQDPQAAASYGNIVYKVELRIRNPRIVRNAEDFQSFKNSERQLQMLGVDAVAGPNDLGQFEIVVFDPADIRILKKITHTLAEAMIGRDDKTTYRPVFPTGNTLAEARSRVPRTLYHAMPADRLPSIMDHGLGGVQMKNFEVSRSNVVYLTDDPDAAESYAINGTLLANPNPSRPMGRMDGLDRSADIVILQIDPAKLNRSLFRQDRNHEKAVYGGRSFEYHGVIPPEALSVYSS
jgi:hypothetical protein